MSANLQLVLDALYDRRKTPGTGCFAVNEAGILLLQSPESILPDIEAVLREVVDPVLASRPNSIKDPNLQDLLGEYSDMGVASVFAGLDHVVGSYLVIGARSCPERILDFLSTLSGNLLIEALRSIPVFFAREGEGWNPGLPPGRQLVALVHSLSRSESRDVQTAAARVLEWLTARVDQPDREGN